MVYYIMKSYIVAMRIYYVNPFVGLFISLQLQKSACQSVREFIFQMKTVKAIYSTPQRPVSCINYKFVGGETFMYVTKTQLFSYKIMNGIISFILTGLEDSILKNGLFTDFTFNFVLNDELASTHNFEVNLYFYDDIYLGLSYCRRRNIILA